MGPLGLQGLLEHQMIFMESPLSEAQKPFPHLKALPLLLGNPEKVFRIAKLESGETT